MVGELIRISFEGGSASDVKNKKKFEAQRAKIQKYNPTAKALGEAVKEHTSRLDRLNQELKEAEEKLNRAEKKAGMLAAQNQQLKTAFGITDSSSAANSVANTSDWIEHKFDKNQKKIDAALARQQHDNQVKEGKFALL